MSFGIFAGLGVTAEGNALLRRIHLGKTLPGRWPISFCDASASDAAALLLPFGCAIVAFCGFAEAASIAQRLSIHAGFRKRTGVLLRLLSCFGVYIGCPSLRIQTHCSRVKMLRW